LLSPSLRFVEFYEFYFPNPVCQAVALALKTGSPITCLKLSDCDFPDRGGGAIVHALQRNSTLKTLRLVRNELDDGMRDALTSLLLVNTTLTDLSALAPWQLGSSAWMHSFFVALRINTSLKKLDVGDLSLSDEFVCAALRDVFEKNSVLKELTLHCDSESIMGDTDVASWRKTPPFSSGQQYAKVIYIPCR
jgi:hypothetical protein